MIAGYSQAGTHAVRLHVKGKGYAMANGSTADFKYAIEFYECFLEFFANWKNYFITCIK